ncbi:MAG: hypothetical protein JWQ30_2351, partial [Sediminibacterium sp.]|nr:hypothetical protein [Sediminibacterium sp.]
MKNQITKTATAIVAGVTALLSLTGLSGCKKNDTPPDYPTNHQSFTVTNLVA